MLVIQLLAALLQLYSYALLARIILSWLPNVSRTNQFVLILHQVTEPVLAPVRRALPPMSGFDLSPLVVFIAIHFVQRLLYNAAGNF